MKNIKLPHRTELWLLKMWNNQETYNTMLKVFCIKETDKKCDDKLTLKYCEYFNEIGYIDVKLENENKNIFHVYRITQVGKDRLKELKRKWLIPYIPNIICGTFFMVVGILITMFFHC